MISYYRCKYQPSLFKTLECILFHCKDRLTTLPLYNINQTLGVVVAVIVWSLELQLPVQSVPITADVVSSNLDQGDAYNIMW